MDSKTIAGATRLSLGAISLPAQAIQDAPKEWEECAGITRAGASDRGLPVSL